MKTFSEIRMLHLEISTKCNARCPGCGRNFHGFPFNGGYTEQDMTLVEFCKLLPAEFLKQIEEIWFNGTRGDFIMNPEGPEMVEYLLESNPKITINISTNGSARNREYWQRLGKTGVNIYFCLDGLADTHSLYRQDTTFETIIENAKIFKSTGGRPIWQYTVFEHNKHQIEQAKEMAHALGFLEFVSRPNNRPDNPVYNRQGQKVFHIGSKNTSNLPDRIDEDYIKKRFTNKIPHSNKNNIQCESVALKSLYIGADGITAPCCYLALAKPHETFGNILKLDDVSKLILTDDQGADSSKPYFPLIQQSWKETPSGICKTFCGK